MDLSLLRRHIQSKLADGRLPRNSIPRVWGGVGYPETCSACDETIAKDQMVMEGVCIGQQKSVHFHVRCFSIWDDLRRTVPA
jgi:hypothetical protein